MKFVDKKNILIKVGLSKSEYDKCLYFVSTNISKEFNGELSPKDIANDIDENAEIDTSIMAVNSVNNELIGCIICKEWSLLNSINQYKGSEIIWNKDWETKINSFKNNGIEGLAMSVDKKYRGSFGVYLMLDELKKLSYDYIIIQQYQNLTTNINYSTKKNIEKVCTIISDELPEIINYYIAII